MDEFTTPGLVLFAQLCGRPEDMTILDEMIATARKLAISLRGDVLDDMRCSLTVKKQDEMRKAVIANQLRWAKETQS
nr:cell division protein ZipA C-terminal FtsZ-binding domain-containing protein [Chromatium okenii]